MQKVAPGSKDPFIERLAVASLCVATLVATFRFTFVRTHARYVFFGLLLLMTGHFFSLLIRNDLHLTYVIAMFIVASAINAAIDFVSGMICYNVVTIGAVFAATYGNPHLAVFLPLGLGTISVVAIVSLTSKQRIIKTLSARTAEFEATIKAFPDWYVKLDAQGKILDSRSPRNQSDPSVKLIPDRYLADVIPDPIAAPVMSALGTCFEEKRPIATEFVWPTSGPKEVWLEARFVPTEDGHTIALVRDISDRVQSQKTIEQQQASIAAKARFAEIGALSAGISHEINNPLAVMLGRSEQLLRKLKADSLDRQMLLKFAEQISDSAMRVAKIVRGLRAFIKDGAQDAFVMTSIKSIVDDAFELCQERAKASRATIEVGVFDPELAADCRPVQIGQVLLNLLNNGIDAAGENQDAKVRIEVKDLGDYIEIWVSDNGPGIPEDIRERILEPFFTTKSQGKGTGLGLSISKAMAESHGGSLELRSYRDPTILVIRLPKHQNLSDSKVA